MDEHLLQSQLEAYAHSGLYPLHMPGHKRRVCPAPGLAAAWDVTEVPGTDDLHDAHGILAAAMARTAALYGARRTWYLVNGSTCGLLAGIRALAPAGSEIIAARNCHKAVFHAIELGALRVHWLVPAADEAFGVFGSVTPAQVQQALNACPAARCVVLTSPTYEGVLSDAAAIARQCHACGVPLLVDEAHGAHLGLFAAGGFPAGAVAAGADLVVQSAHKTLPSLTQTAFLHLAGPLADPDEVERQLDVFETSSPSYPLLASLDGCTGLLAHRGEALFAAWGEALARFDDAVQGLRALRVFCHGADALAAHPAVFAHDKSKLLVRAPGGVTGAALAAALRARFGFETEMHCGSAVLAMTSMADTPAALDAFAAALCALDEEILRGELPAAAPDELTAPGQKAVLDEKTAAWQQATPDEKAAPGQQAAPDAESASDEVASTEIAAEKRPLAEAVPAAAAAEEVFTGGAVSPATCAAKTSSGGAVPPVVSAEEAFSNGVVPPAAPAAHASAAAPAPAAVSAPALASPAPGGSVLSIAAALAAPAAPAPRAAAAGRVCGEYVWAYPPGVPLLVPGERIAPALLAHLDALEAAGTALHFSRTRAPRTILCLTVDKGGSAHV